MRGYVFSILSKSGGLAQLGERLHGMQEVSGSIPLSSTRLRSLSSRGLGHDPFTVGTGVRIPVGTPSSFRALARAKRERGGLRTTALKRCKKNCTRTLSYVSIRVPANGGLAQLGERLHGMQEVSGSIPLSSTKSRSLSSRGLGHDPFTVGTGVRIPVGTPVSKPDRLAPAGLLAFVACDAFLTEQKKRRLSCPALSGSRANRSGPRRGHPLSGCGAFRPLP